MYTYRFNEFTEKEIECEEKPAIYRINFDQHCYYRVVRKDQIGTVLGTFEEDVFLIEKDISKAASILLESQKRKFERKEKELEKIKDKIAYLETVAN